MRFHSPLAIMAAVFLSSQPSPAQAPADVAGTYNGSDPDIGTELRLEPNGRFEYHLSYGALDERAQGTWTRDGTGVVLTSDPVKAPVFQFLGAQTGDGAELVVTLDAPRQLPLQLFSAFLQQPDGNVAEVTFADGPLHIPVISGKAPFSIAIALPAYQVASQPYAISPGTRAMRFRFVPNDLGKIAFDHHRLPWDGNAFVLRRLDRTILYRKEAAIGGTGSGASGAVPAGVVTQ
jgi:hypothetical protein